MPSSVRRSFMQRPGTGRALKASCMRRVGARFCQNNVSLWAPDPQGGASNHTGSPSMCNLFDLRVFVSSREVFYDV